MRSADTDEFFLDPRAVRRSFDAASGTYDAAAAVHAEIRARLLERLDIVRLQPAVVLDLGAGTGHAARALRQRYPDAQVIALDLSESMLRQAARQQRLFRRFQRLVGDAHRLPLKDASVDLVFSNLMLEWCADPDAAFSEMRRVLRPQGLLSFTTLGPDTLKELREAWRRIDGRVHVHRFIDMHDLGDALLRARFAEPVMDVERLTVTYSSVQTLFRELKASGSRNIAQGRSHGLTGRKRWRALEHYGESSLREGALPISVEVVYGQAWAGELRPIRPAAGEVRVPITDLKRRPTL
ncbi:MAG: malonyl-ACP O-methyltransferase BioC [Steroidobacter sp.]